MVYRVDERTQKMLQKLAEQRAQLELQASIIFQILINTLGILPGVKVAASSDFSTLAVEEEGKKEDGGHA